MAHSEHPAVSPELRRNRRVAIICAATFFGMMGAAYASVPLYRAFCQATGFNGTVRKAETAPDQVLSRKLTIRFDTNVRDLPWTFAAEHTTQSVRIGDTALAYFKVTNHGQAAITGRAVFNVTPQQAGAYFQKLECFCFSDQTIKAGQTVDFPVVYFVDPAYAKDPETKNGEQVTLSYTFYPATDGGKSADASRTKSVSTLGGSPRGGL
jgi:cytochrome c oxidase assembly protein subunit 11